MASATSVVKSTASKRQRDEVAKSDNGNGGEKSQKGTKSVASADIRAAEAAKKVAAEGLKGNGQVPAPPRAAEKTADVPLPRGKGGKGAETGVGKPTKTPGIMRTSELTAGQRKSRTLGKGGVGASTPNFPGPATALSSGTSFSAPIG